MKIHQIRDPKFSPAVLPESFKSKIALIGAGPSSLSCAAFLTRMGYSDVSIFEKRPFAGGVPATDIPQYRIPIDELKDEIAMCLELGVKMVYGKELGKDFTIESLKKDGFQAIFLGVGVPKPISLPIFAEAEKCHNFTTASVFLKKVAMATKKLDAHAEMPKLDGHVLVLGGGDVAYNTAGAALRCGAKRVTIAFREDFLNLPCCKEELNESFKEKIDLMANALPHSVTVKDGNVVEVVLKKNDWTKEDSLFTGEQLLHAHCSHVIVAFGHRGDAAPLAPCEVLPSGHLKVDPATNMTTVPGVFAGGDCAGSVNIVEGVNDAKTAAWNMHKMLAKGVAVPSVPNLPMFCTPVDLVDLSVTVCGVKFVNPFGLSSATPTGTVGQIRRAFEMGWGFAVTKTLMHIPATNVSPRIIRVPNNVKRGPSQVAFQNIELLTEKCEQYWAQGINVLKQAHPDKVVICSIMAPAEKEEWQHVARIAENSMADMIEMNLSCPHVGKKGFGMLAGQDPEMVKQLTQWCREVTKKPLVVKLTPNVTDIAQLAIAAKDGGADAVTAINTVSVLSNIQPSGVPYPAVGTDQKTAYGGMSGNGIRPIALKAVSAIRRALPNFPILGSGGMDSPESAMQFLNAGASVIQSTSCIQNQSYAIIGELCSGLQALLYMKGRPDLAQWKGMTPPETIPAPQPIGKIPTIQDMLNVAVKHISVVPEMQVRAQVRANVDSDRCLHCGKCYMSCNDTGYHAIMFNPVTHIPEISDDCMGCGLCQSVCPADCISYTLKDYPHKPCRGDVVPRQKDVGALPFDDGYNWDAAAPAAH